MMKLHELENKELAAYITKSLRKAIDEDGRSDYAIDRDSGMSMGYVNHLYNGRRIPSAITLLRLCSSIGKSPNEVLGWDTKD